MNILVCDDEVPLRRMVAEYLTERGHECAQAEDAAALRRQIARRRPDLIILDVRMPGEDGLSALRALRSEGDPPPVIMLTAVSDTIGRVVGLELGADDYLSKRWVRDAERDAGLRAGPTGEEREVCELRQADEILRKASGYSAMAELHRRSKP